MRPRAPTGAPGVSKLAWLFQAGLLGDLTVRVTAWLESFDGRREFDGYDGAALQCPFYCENFFLEAFSEEIARIHDATFVTTYGIDARYFAEQLLYWGPEQDRWLSSDDGEIFIGNWKFDRAMRVEGTPLLPLVAHASAPLLLPLEIGYESFVSSIEMVLRSAEPITVAALGKALLEQDIHIDASLLLSVLRNDFRFLLTYGDSNGAAVSRSESLLQGWSLASDLFDPLIYMTTTGLGLDGTKFVGVKHELRIDELKRFLKFHQNVPIDWCHLDWLEVCLKLKEHRKRTLTLIQGVPAKLHAFIVSWIKSSKRVWLPSVGERVLGASYLFDPADIAPGPLLVYGTTEGLQRGAKPGLVLREMVSEGRQRRGLIHSSKVLTPFDEADIEVTAEVVQEALARDALFRTRGLAHLMDLASSIIRNAKVIESLYLLKKLAARIEDVLPTHVRSIGLGLVIDCSIFPVQVACAQTRRELRREIFLRMVDEIGDPIELLQIARPHAARLLGKAIGAVGQSSATD